MSTRPEARAVSEPNVGSALRDAFDAVADMAQRIQLYRPEPTYASETLSFALYKTAAALALCGADLGEVGAEACKGFRHCRAIQEEVER